MAAREALHQMIDEIPDEDLPAVERLLAETLRAQPDPVLRALDSAPPDDEPDDDDADGGLTEARAAAEAGEGITTTELRRRLGLV